jgi:hypothetical protein
MRGIILLEITNFYGFYLWLSNTSNISVKGTPEAAEGGLFFFKSNNDVPPVH